MRAGGKFFQKKKKEAAVCGERKRETKKMWRANVDEIKRPIEMLCSYGWWHLWRFVPWGTYAIRLRGSCKSSSHNRRPRSTNRNRFRPTGRWGLTEHKRADLPLLSVLQACLVGVCQPSRGLHDVRLVTPSPRLGFLGTLPYKRDRVPLGYRGKRSHVLCCRKRHSVTFTVGCTGREVTHWTRWQLPSNFYTLFAMLTTGIPHILF